MSVGAHVPAARPLYIFSADASHIATSDLALTVRTHSGRTFRYPAARIARVVCSTRINWTGCALALCMKQGIGITWIAEHSGDALGSAFPCLKKRLPSSLHIALLLESVTGLVNYEQWHRARRMLVLNGATKLNGATPTPREWQSLKREWVYKGHLSPHLPLRLKGLCTAYTVGLLQSLEIEPEYLGPQAQAISLVADVTELIWAEFNFATGIMADQAADPKTLTSVLEAWLSQHPGVGAAHVHALLRSAIEAMRT